ncbi:MAG: hypothetical protein Ta2G_16730 [Termitinemataceae bacterium]|nr:MAG: hypothetical protein Ta2G_16730 [Termitinemataceae bacterium]
MNNKNNLKITDCVKFKQELHNNSIAASGAKNFDEYIKCVNEKFLKSQWNREQILGSSKEF